MLHSSMIAHIIDRYSSSSDFLRSDDREKAISEIIPRISSDVTDEFCNFQFLIFKPETVASGKVIEALSRLEENGIILVYSELVFNIDESIYENLYRYNIDIGNYKSILGRIWMSIKPYCNGPAIIAIVTVDHEVRSRTSFEIVSSLKGASNPAECRPGSLRYDLGIISRTMNVIHCSDDPFSSFREASLVMPAEKLVNLMVQIRQLREGRELQRVHSETVERVYGMLSPMKPYDTDANFPMCLLRTMKKLAQHVRSDEFRIDILNVLEECQIGAGSDLFVAMIEIERLFSSIRNLLVSKGYTSYSVNTADSFICYLMLLLSDLRSLDHRQAKSIIASLRAYGSHVNSWDELMMITNFGDINGSLLKILYNE